MQREDMKTKLAITAPTTSLEDAPPPVITELPGRYAAATLNASRMFGPYNDHDYGLLVIGPLGAQCPGYMAVPVYCSNAADRAAWHSVLGDEHRGCISVCLRRVEPSMPAHWVIDGHSMYDPNLSDKPDSPETPWTEWKLNGDPHYEAYDPQPLNGPDGKQIVTPDPRILAAQFLCQSAGDPKAEALHTSPESVINL